MRFLALYFALAISANVKANINPKVFTENLRDEINQGNLKQKTIDAIDAALRFGTEKLRDKGLDSDADRIMSDWLYSQKAFLLDDTNLKSITDHEPIKWLYDVWFLLNSVFGETAMRLFHLDDLKDFAYGLRTTFICFDHPNKEQYAECFIPVIEGITYWLAYAACEAAAAAEGAAWALLCSPIASLCEDAMTMFISPRLSPIVWKQVCKEI